MADRLTLEVSRDGWTKGLQLSINQRDEKGLGSGYRLAGPKFNGSGETLLTRTLTEEDAKEIRTYLDAMFPLPPVPVSDGDKLWNEAVDWLLNSRHTAGPDIQRAFWGMVEGKYTRDQADNGCLPGEDGDGD